MMKEKEGETEEEKKHWKNADVEVMSHCMERWSPSFSRMQKKRYVEFFVVQFFFQKKQKKNLDFRLGQLGLLKAFAFASSPPYPP
jgi:hypothetical protein